MTPDPLALVAAMPLPKPNYGRSSAAMLQLDLYTVETLRSERLKAAQLVLAQLVLAQGEPVAWLCAWPGWTQYHDARDPLPAAWDGEPPASITPLYVAPFSPAPEVNAEVLVAPKNTASETAATWASYVANAAIASAEAAKGAA